MTSTASVRFAAIAPVFLLATMIVAGGPGGAWADPLLIQSGFVGRSGGDPAAFRFVADGLALTGIMFRGGDDFGPYRTCAYSSPCNLGESIDFSSTFKGVAFPSGPVTVGGNRLPGDAGNPTSGNPEYPNVVFTGDFRLDGPTIAAPPIGPLGYARLSAPFTFTGSLIGYAAQGSYEGYVLGPQLFTLSLIGRGDAILHLSPPACQTGDCVPGPPYHVALLDYRFAPVPEPGTLVLLALGSGAMAVTRALRRRRT